MCRPVARLIAQKRRQGCAFSTFLGICLSPSNVPPRQMPPSDEASDLYNKYHVVVSYLQACLNSGACLQFADALPGHGLPEHMPCPSSQTLKKSMGPALVMLQGCEVTEAARTCHPPGHPPRTPPPPRQRPGQPCPPAASASRAGLARCAGLGTCPGRAPGGTLRCSLCTVRMAASAWML